MKIPQTIELTKEAMTSREPVYALTRREQVFLRGWQYSNSVYRKDFLARRQSGMCAYKLTVTSGPSYRYTVELVCRGERTLISSDAATLDLAKTAAMRAATEHNENDNER